MSSRESRLAAIITPTLADRGLDIDAITVATIGRREHVRVTVDRDGGVDLDTLAQVSADLSTQLDSEPDLFPHPYVLEISSPGVDRPLTELRHWIRARGHLVAVTTAQGGEVHGRVIGVEGSEVSLTLATGETVSLPWADVAHAVVEVEFTRDPGA